jgi:hypothetical protein
VNGSAPLPKNPVDCVEDESCEPIDLTTSHAADAAPKAISMIKTSQCRAMRPLPLLPIVSKCRARQKAQQINPFAHGTDVAGQAIAAAAAGFAALDSCLRRFLYANRPPFRAKALTSYRIAAALCPC